MNFGRGGGVLSASFALEKLGAGFPGMLTVLGREPRGFRRAVTAAVRAMAGVSGGMDLPLVRIVE